VGVAGVDLLLLLLLHVGLALERTVRPSTVHDALRTVTARLQYNTDRCGLRCASRGLLDASRQ